MDKYTNYKYYRGEKEDPYKSTDFGKSFWWTMELYAFEANDEKEKDMLSMTMIHYLQEHMWEGDGLPDTTKEEMLKRADELYNQGFWSRNYICSKRYTFQQAAKESKENSK